MCGEENANEAQIRIQRSNKFNCIQIRARRTQTLVRRTEIRE